jgi:hypothetical protein
MIKPTTAVKTARSITRGFKSAMKSGTRAAPNHEAMCTRDTGTAVVFMLYSSDGPQAPRDAATGLVTVALGPTDLVRD